MTGRSGADDRDPLLAGGDLGHDVRDARRLVPLDEEALHRADRQRPVDVAATAGPLARGGADVRAHRRDRVRVAGQDVALFEPSFGGEVQVAAAVGPDGAGFLAFDVALEPGGVDGLDEEFLGRFDGQAGSCLSVRSWLGRRRRIGGDRRPEFTIRARRPAKARGGTAAAGELTLARVAATLPPERAAAHQGVGPDRCG